MYLISICRSLTRHCLINSQIRLSNTKLDIVRYFKADTEIFERLQQKQNVKVSSVNLPIVLRDKVMVPSESDHFVIESIKLRQLIKEEPDVLLKLVQVDNPRLKTIKVSYKIDDHMLSIKVDKVSELLKRGLDVLFVVQLPSSNKNLSPQEEKMESALINSYVQRFKESLEKLPNIKLSKRTRSLNRIEFQIELDGTPA